MTKKKFLKEFNRLSRKDRLMLLARTEAVNPASRCDFGAWDRNMDSHVIKMLWAKRHQDFVAALYEIRPSLLDRPDIAAARNRERNNLERRLYEE